MNAIELLEKQHREVENLFKKIEKAEGDGREQRALFTELADNLDNHAKIEEKYFYPAGRKVDEDVTLESYEEHAILKSLIRKLRNTKTSDETFKAKLTVLKEIVEHHVEEEEEEYFPKCEKTLGEPLLNELGEKMEIAFNRLMGFETPKAERKGSPRTYQEIAA